jgi:hypothetical protein
VTLPELIRQFKQLVADVAMLKRWRAGLRVRGAQYFANPESGAVVVVGGGGSGDGGGNRGPTYFRITAASQDGTNKRWAYSATQVYKSGTAYNNWSDGPLTTTTLYNTLEDQNGATGTWGNGVASTNLTGTLAIKAIPTGTRVMAWPIHVGSVTEYWTQYASGIDGGC